MGYYIANGVGDSLDQPSVEQMRQMLDELDVTDVEHGAAWLSTDEGWSLEWNGDGRLVLSCGGEQSRHVANVSRERAATLWQALAENRLDEVEAQDWKPGNGFVVTPERQQQMADAARALDRKFYDLLGEERADVPCKTTGCGRGAIALSVLCRPHHFAMVQRRPCPFDD